MVSSVFLGLASGPRWRILPLCGIVRIFGVSDEDWTILETLNAEIT